MLSVAVVAASGQVAPLPAARSGGALLELWDDPYPPTLYYIGGIDASGTPSRAVFVYHYASNTWTVGDSLIEARTQFGAGTLRGRFYVYGGVGDGGRLLSSCEVYDSIARRWAPFESLPTPRMGMFSGTDHDRVYSIGGSDGSRVLDDNMAYDERVGHWGERARIPTPRFDGATCFGGLIWCFGGTDDGVTRCAANELYLPWADTWFTRTPIPEARTGCSGCFDVPIVVGGTDGFGQVTASSLVYDIFSGWSWWTPLSSPLHHTAVCHVYLPWQQEAIIVAGGTDASGATSAWVDEIYLPLAVAELPASARASSTSPSLVRAGQRVAAPRAATGRELLSADGRVVDRASGSRMSVVPDLAAGVYVARWSGTETVTRLVVVRR